MLARRLSAAESREAAAITHGIAREKKIVIKIGPDQLVLPPKMKALKVGRLLFYTKGPCARYTRSRCDSDGAVCVLIRAADCGCVRVHATDCVCVRVHATHCTICCENRRPSQVAPAASCHLTCLPIGYAACSLHAALVWRGWHKGGSAILSAPLECVLDGYSQCLAFPLQQHCMMCGEVFCSACASKRAPIPKMGIETS